MYTGDGSSWTEARARVQDISCSPGEGCNITMQQPGFALVRGRAYGQGVTFPRATSNVFSLLGPDTPGAYYANKASRTLYVCP